MKAFLYKSKYEITVGVLFAAKLARPVYGEADGWTVARLACVLACIYAAARLLGAFLNAAAATERPAALALTAMFAASCAPNEVLMLDDWYAGGAVYANTAVILLSAVSLVLYKSPKENWLLPVFCFICSALEPLYLFTLFPAVAAALFMETAVGKNAAREKTVLAACAAACIAGFAFFGRELLPADFAAAAANARAAWRPALLSFAVTLPLPVAAAAVVFRVAPPAGRGGVKQAAACILALPALSLFALLFGAGRVNFVTAAVFSQFVALCAFLRAGDKAALEAAAKTGEFVEKHGFPLVLLLILLAAFSCIARADSLYYFAR